MECKNLCKTFMRKETCEYCQKNYIVSSEFYTALRSANYAPVTGYLVKDKDGNIKGILNEKTKFQELAWIEESTLRLFSNGGPNNG